MTDNIAGERYRKPPSLADADAIRAIKRELEIRRLMAQLIGALAALYTTPADPS